MKTSRKLSAALAGSLILIIGSAQMAAAQIKIDPSGTPVENNGGWVFSMAWLLAIMGFVTALFLIVMYMRYAPRFAKDESGLKVVRADRVKPGEDLPRRAVDLSQAAPMVVAPPALPVAVGAVVSAPAPAATAVAAAPAPAAAAPAATVPAAEPPAAPAGPPAAAPAVASPPPPAAPAKRVEVAMDQEVFDAKLAELLAAGTDKRVAEGQARRAGMIAARKKAEEG
jgi:hypothetical protein